MTSSAAVVVTGATKGVGRAIAERFAKDGARIGLLARGPAALDETARAVERLGGTALPLPTDVADYQAVAAAAAAMEESIGPIDIWINNAMTTVFAFFDDIEPEEFRRATEVTYLGAVWGTKVALDRMLPRNRGTIVQVGSAMAYRGIPLQVPYCGAKHALKGFWESLRTELQHKGVDIHMPMVQLPGLNTPQFEHCRAKLPRKPMPVPPIYQPEIAAEAVHLAAYDRGRRQVFVGAPTWYTILGERLVPWLGDWYMAKTGVGSQQTDEPIDPPRPGNLFEPVSATPGAHGAFAAQAHTRSPLFWLSKHRRAIAGGAGLVGGVSAAVVAALRS